VGDACGSEEVEDAVGIVGVPGIDNGKEVGEDASGAQTVEGNHDLGVGGSTVGPAPEVMVLCVSIQAESNRKLMVGEEPHPRRVEGDPVGLEPVGVPAARWCQPALKFDHQLEERQTGQGGFSAVPLKVGHRPGGRSKALGHQLFQHRGRHESAPTGKPLFLFQVVAVAATQVATRADGLDHDQAVPEGRRRHGTR